MADEPYVEDIVVQFEDDTKDFEVKMYPEGDYGDISERVESIEQTLPTKADASDVEALEQTVAGKADSSDVEAIEEALDGKADANEVTSLKEDLNESVGELKNALTTKADQDGAYPDLTAGQMLSKNEATDSVPYNFRAVGHESTLEYIDAIVGGTVVWNQLVDALPQTDTVNGITYTNNGNGTITVSGTASSISSKDISIINNVQLNHVYLLSSNVAGSSWGSYLSIYDYNETNAYSTRSALVYKKTLNNTARLRTQVWAEQTVNFTITPQLFDLTQMFGSDIADHIHVLEQATAGAGVAFFRKLFPKDYYPYDAGSLKSVEGLQSHETVGFNQWDEEWELGAYNTNTGDKSASSSQIRSKNRIPVVSNTDYCFQIPYTSVLAGFAVLMCYDANGNYLRYINGTSNGMVVTIPSDVYQIAFFISTLYGTTYNHDICINLSDPAKNGTYEPYQKRTYPLDSTKTFRGIFKLDSNNQLYTDGDRYLPDGIVQRRYGIVDLGTLEWKHTSQNRSQATLNARKPIDGTDLIGSITQNGYKQLAPNQTLNADGQYAFSNNQTNNLIFYYDGEHLPSGYMLYEVATPTTEEADSYTIPQIVDPDGTEEFVSTSIVPVGHESRYPDDLRAKLDGLPWNLSMIAPIENKNTASQAYAVDKYFLHNNQFCKAKTAIAQNATFTLGTNYDVTTVADELYAALH